MSQAKPIHSMELAAFDAATLALDRAIGLLHCVHAARDPDNMNTVAPALISSALDGVTAIVELARDLLVGRPKSATIVEFPERR